MKKYIPLLAMFMVAMLLGCEANALIKTESFLDGSVEIDIPIFWIEHNNLNEVAEFQVGDPRLQAFFIIIPEEKNYYDPLIPLEEHSALTRGLLESNTKEASAIGEPVWLEVNGMKGLQYEIKAKIDLADGEEMKTLDLNYLHTTIEGKNRFYQVVGWTLEEHYSKHVETMKGIVQTLREQ